MYPSLSVDRTLNAAYIRLHPKDAIRELTLCVDPNINLEFDAQGRLLGIEVLSPPTRLHCPRVLIDRDIDAGYIRVQPRDVIGERTLAVDSDITLDLDSVGSLVGVEILSVATRLHPALVRDAVWPGA